jgi:nitrous oxidase accessory protein
MLMLRRFLSLLLITACGLPFAIPAQAQDSGETIIIPAEELANTIAAAHEGDTIAVHGGVFKGSLEIDKSLTLIGSDWPVIDGQNEGTVIRITAPGTQFRGFSIKNSGSSLDQQNSGISVEAEDVTIENNRFEDTLFGIYLQEAHRGIVRGNTISSKDLEVQRRGDPIRIWYSTDVLIENNVVDKGRDVVLWYS